MKKVLNLVMIVAVCAIALQSCKSKPSEADVKTAAKDFINAVKNEDYAKAKELGTDGTDKMLTQIEMVSSMVPDSLQDEYNARQASRKSATVTMGATTFNEEGTQATVKFTTSDAPDREEEIILKKVDKKWLADMESSMPADM